MSDAVDMILSGGPFAVFKWRNDPLWTVEYVSPNLHELFGYDPADFLSGKLQLSDLIHEDDARRVADEAKRQMKEHQGIGHQEYRLRKAGGGFVWVSDYTRVLRDAKGHVTHYLGYLLEITRQKQAEASLEEKTRELEEKSRGLMEANTRLEAVQKELQALNASLEERTARALSELREKDAILLKQSRHAALGEMIGNIAHQWRQPLNALAIIVQDLEEAYKYGELDEARIRETAGRSMLLINYLSTTIDDFRNFFRAEKEKKPFVVQEAVTQSIELVEAAMRNHNIEIAQKFDTRPAEAIGFGNEFAQALVNILTNAKDAIVERGIENGRIEVAVKKEEGRIAVTVRDNGGGIDETIVEKIFDPYFTTKHQAQGTGIGLYMTKMIIERNMGGEIGVRNVEGGAEFRITLPL
ncbi:MAG: ATP-binding protein [Campylobacterales bacterium]